MVIFEFVVPAEQFVLAEVLAAFPTITLEFERLVPTDTQPLPYLWTMEGESPVFEATLTDAPKVDTVEKVGSFEEGALYQVEWLLDGDGLLQWIADRSGVALLQTEGEGSEWRLKLRFRSRAVLADFRQFYAERDIDFQVVRVYDLMDPKLGQYNVSEKQRTALLRALEMGLFEVPRGTTLEDVAAELGISPKALSERLRRGQTNLISNSLVIGNPTGVGIDGE